MRICHKRNLKGHLRRVSLTCYPAHPAAPDDLDRPGLRGHAVRLHRDGGLGRDAGLDPRQLEGGLQGDLRGRGQRRQLHLDQRHAHLQGRHARTQRPQRLQARRKQSGTIEYSNSIR